MYKRDHKHERSYTTRMGFHLGDRVQLPDGRQAYIDEIVIRNVNYHQFDFGPRKLIVNATVVRLDDEYWLDNQLTRIE